MNRVQLLAVDGDASYLDTALREASRANDYDTGRRLLALHDRDGVARAVPDVPRTLEPIRYRGIELAWDAATARLFAADCAEHVLHLYEEEYPDDPRPRRAIKVARQYALGLASDEELRLARDAAEAATSEAGAGAAAHTPPREAAWAARESAWAAMAAARETVSDAAARESAWAARAGASDAAMAAEINWQRQLLIRYLLGEVTL